MFCLIRQAPEHIFQVFLEVREPIDKEGGYYYYHLSFHEKKPENSSLVSILVPDILRKYPADYVDESLKTTMSFVYPCKIPS